MSDVVMVNARSDYINSAIVITSLHILFLPININIFILTMLSKRLKSSAEVFNIIIFNVTMTLISRSLYALFAYFWWYSYLTGRSVQIDLTNFVEDLRFMGTNMFFLTPFILSFWRYTVIYLNRETPISWCIIIYVIFLLPNILQLYYSNWESRSMINGDIFTKTYAYTNKYIFIVCTLPQVICPILTLYFIFSIVKKIKDQCEEKKITSYTEKLTKNIIMSLIISSSLPMIASLLTFSLHIIHIFQFKTIPRTLWNISEVCLSLISGSNPISMVIYMKTFRSAINDIINVNKICVVRKTKFKIKKKSIAYIIARRRNNLKKQ